MPAAAPSHYKQASRFNESPPNKELLPIYTTLPPRPPWIFRTSTPILSQHIMLAEPIATTIIIHDPTLLRAVFITDYAQQSTSITP